MNTHNTCIKENNSKFYLYYMGTTYGGNIPTSADDMPLPYCEETWNRNRVGVAVSDGRITTQGNLDRPSVVFDENGEPTHIFFVQAALIKSRMILRITPLSCV